MSALEAVFLATSLVGLASVVVYLGCAIAVEIGLKRADKARTGVDLISPWPVFPLMGCLVCGIDLLAPRLAQRFVSYVVTIRQAPVAWQRCARIGALAGWVGLAAGTIGYGLTFAL